MTSEKIINDLLTKCQYKYKDLSKKDLNQALSYFKELTVKTDRYVYHTGIIKELVCLTGTIPVNFRNNVYNIPVQVYLNDSHPYESPIAYVRPTPDMSINVSETVDQSGKINLPCLREWNYKNSDLYFLLNCMAIKFSEQTPLYSKVNNRVNSAVATATVTPNMLPYPTSYGQIPTYPSYPMPGQNSFPVTSYVDQNIPYPTSSNPYYPMPPTQQPITHIKSGPSSSIGQTRTYADDTIKPEHYRMSLISAVQEKIRKKYLEVYEEKQAEIDSLRRVRNDLEQSKLNLTSMITDGKNEIENIKQLTGELEAKKGQLSEAINRMMHRDKASIEDAVVTTTPLYRQLLQLFAEEMSIQDLVFYLSQGLTHRTISLENFLKQVRFLSRKQFFLRATMQKAREQAALPL